MRLVFSLFKYFPYGGLQRDFFRIAECCARRGHEVHVMTRQWDGQKPECLQIHLLPVKAFSNNGKNRQFYCLVQQKITELQPDLVIGFNKMPGLDVYFAADPCYAAKVDEARKSWLYRMTPRYRHFRDFEQQLFSDSNARFFVLTDQQANDYQRYYQTAASQFYKLPPGIARDRQAGDDADQLRNNFREEFGLAESDNLLLLLGSGFRTKGVDRAIGALAALPNGLREKTRLFVVGKDNPARYQQQAKQLGINEQVRFFSGRDDIPRFLQGADLLIHPAYSEAAGMVLLEAIVAGLPILVTDVCGFAYYIDEARAGVIHKSPFNAQQFTEQLQSMLEGTKQRLQWRENGIGFGRSADIFNLPERASDLIEQFAREKQQ